MKKSIQVLLLIPVLAFGTMGFAQTSCTGWGGYSTSGNEIDCPNGMNQCCIVYNACNGPQSPCWNYDYDFSGTGGCDLSCTPIDSGVLFLLFGGAAFGGMMIMRRRREALEVIKQ
jgi:hypothetical protein